MEGLRMERIKEGRFKTFLRILEKKACDEELDKEERRIWRSHGKDSDKKGLEPQERVIMEMMQTLVYECEIREIPLITAIRLIYRIQDESFIYNYIMDDKCNKMEMHLDTWVELRDRFEIPKDVFKRLREMLHHFGWCHKYHYELERSFSWRRPEMRLMLYPYFHYK